mgnify:CR=1 FL=1
MNITEVRVKLLGGRSDRLRAFCSITINDEFVVHDLRVIEGRKGMFVAMPSRKLSDGCPRCGGKNHLRAKFCSDCGEKLDENRAKDHDKFHVDVAHPILPACRDMIQSVVLEAYRRELAAHPAGVPPASAEGLEDYHEGEDYGDYAEEEWDQQGRRQQGVEELGSLATGLSELEEGESSAGTAKEQSKDYDADLPDRPDRKASKRSGKRDQQGRFGEGIL